MASKTIGSDRHKKGQEGGGRTMIEISLQGQLVDE